MKHIIQKNTTMIAETIIELLFTLAIVAFLATGVYFVVKYTKEINQKGYILPDDRDKDFKDYPDYYNKKS